MLTSRCCRTAILSIVAILCLGLFVLPAAAQAPLRVGNHHPIVVDSRGDTDVESVPTPTGRLFTVSHPGATYIALHFAEFDLAPGDALRVSDKEGNQAYTLTGRGKMDAGEFWSQHVKGDTAVLELVSTGLTLRRGFRIDEYVAGFADLGGPEAICGTDDKDNAVCYQTSHPTEYDRSRAVARLLIQGSSLCTGWLASATNHLITNEHCISSATAALNTDYEFMSEAPNCGSSNCQLCWTGDIISGADLIQDSPALDYALVQITSGNPAAMYGFLSIDNRDAVIGEEIYIPQHPGGRAKELGIESSASADGGLCHVNTFSPGCSSSSYQDVGYQCDTEGGSSGSPVLARSSHKVIALHHCANCPNRGVPIDLVCAEVCSLLGPECTVDADCDDGNPCTQDRCSNTKCTNPPLASCCGNGTCESGEDCNSCAADCISGTSSGAMCGNDICETADGEDCVTCAQDCNGKQNGRPSDRFCCGNGGENPVFCDTVCANGGNTCTTEPAPGGSYCCGDFVCEGSEDTASCAIDCQLSCGAKNSPCDVNSDCCSDNCKSNGRCR